MKTALLYMEDAYLREFDAKVLGVEENGVVLDQTAFYYRGGGQPSDTGKLVVDGTEYAVAEVRKEGGEILHGLDRQQSFAEGTAVHGVIDWEPRYKHMRMHTAGHVLAKLMADRGALITGNQIGAEQTRFDFALENFDRELMERLVSEANAKLAEKLEVRAYTLPREEAMKIPGIVKLANALPPAVRELRIVDIGGFDVQADGGTHVRNTGECGKIRLVKMENKGKNNRRIYFGLEG